MYIWRTSDSNTVHANVKWITQEAILAYTDFSRNLIVSEMRLSQTFTANFIPKPVSYTHLDVYKRQMQDNTTIWDYDFGSPA